MAVREILKMGDPRLLRVAQPVREFGTPELHALIADMFDTMAAARGVGLAAPQIGEDLQLVIFGSTSSERYPDAPGRADDGAAQPDDHAAVRRDGRGLGGLPVGARVARRGAALPRIRYSGFDPEGRRIEREAEGFHARVVQHECDHLIGRLYPTRMRDLTKLGYTSVLFPDLDDAGDD